MKWAGLFFVLVLLLSVAGTGFSASLVQASPGTIYVDDDATGTNDGTSWANAFNYLQDALIAAETGDEIWIAEGTYRPDQGGGNIPGDREAAFQLINGVGLYGGFAGGETDLGQRDWDSHQTVLSGDLAGDDDGSMVGTNSDHVVTGGGTTETTILDGFKIRHGHSSDSGGGLYNVSGNLTIVNCAFEQNHGSAIYNHIASPVILNCIFSNNAGFLGGGIYNEQSSPTIRDSSFLDNWAMGSGGGMYNHGGSPQIMGCYFEENGAESGGGAIHNLDSHPSLVSCNFTRNGTENGGAVSNFRCEAAFVSCLFLNNWGWTGAGVLNIESNIELTNCLFDRNVAGFGNGGAICSWRGSITTVVNCTFYGNEGFGPEPERDFCGGIYDSGGRLSIVNSILWNNSDDRQEVESAQLYSDNGDLSVDHTCVMGWTGMLGGTGNFGEDPLLSDPDGADNITGTDDDDLRLSTDSPYIDAGDNSLVPPGVTTDLVGNPRFSDGDGDGEATVDLGPYEMRTSPAFTVDFDPDQLALASNSKTITAHIEPPDGYQVSDIDISSIKLNDVIPPLPAQIEIGDHDLDKIADLMVKFDREAVESILPPGGEVEIILTGQINGATLEGKDTVTLTDKIEPSAAGLPGHVPYLSQAVAGSACCLLLTAFAMVCYFSRRNPC